MDDASTSRVGGAIVGIRASYALRLTAHTTHTIIPGRSVSICLQARGGVRLQCISVHIDPSFTRPRIEHVMQQLRIAVEAQAPNFMEDSEGRLHTEAGNRYSVSMVSPVFHRELPQVVEHFQPLHTFRRTTGRPEDATYSRIDRWYSTLDELALRSTSIAVGVLGGFHLPTQSSDHLPLSIAIRPRSPNRRPQPRIPPQVASSEVFIGIFTRKVDDLLLTGCPSRRITSLTELAHEAAHLIARVLVSNGDATPKLYADAAIRAYSLLRAGRLDAASRVGMAIPRLATLIDALDYDGILRYHRGQMEEQLLLDMAALERSAAPEQHKTPHRTQLTRQHAAVRAQHRRVDATALYRSDGSLCHSADEIGAELNRKWAPVFCARHSDADAMRLFLPYVQQADLSDSWRWERGLLRDVAAGAHDSTPGTDGLGYSFWANAPTCVLDVLDDVAEAAQLSVPLPPALHSSRTVQIPKAELLAEPDDVRPTADTLRPLTMITTGESCSR